MESRLSGFFCHATSRSTLSNSFWKSTKTAYRGACHSTDCSKLMRMVTMWSVHERSCRKPACSPRSRLSRVVFSLSNIILVKTLPGMNSNIIPHQLPQDDMSPFLGSFTRCPFFQSSGTFSRSQILLRVGETCLLRLGCRPSELQVVYRLGLLPFLTLAS